ncbi:MAG: mechanosensitive ion channel [Sedimentisphaerales bacterium]|nr:mechanosensitive ion channel [Sedimentisphaerales bacterium]
MENLIGPLKELSYFFAIIIIAAGIAWAGHYILFMILKRLAGRTKSSVDESLIRHCYRPARWTLVFIVLLFAARLATPLVEISTETLSLFRQLFSLLLIISISWLVIKITYGIRDYIMSQYRIDVADNLDARKIHTQLKVLIRIVIIIVCILALGTMLMTFEKVRQVGTSILASAGIIGIVVGMAAQRSIATLIAGMQIAITQPIRIDDVVIVENEWGRIEDINLTYVVVKIWDLRRLIVPITYFIEKPFQNWTRVSADLLGTAYLYVDYSVPVREIEKELHRILQESEYWDKKVCVLQVTNTTERSVELRALMSARDASIAWNLRCQVREKLLDFVRNNYPDGLPKVRAEITRRKPDPCS